MISPWKWRRTPSVHIASLMVGSAGTRWLSTSQRTDAGGGGNPAELLGGGVAAQEMIHQPGGVAVADPVQRLDQHDLVDENISAAR